MTDHAAFLSAILARPDDPLPRLVYADFLDERGDPRGEFVRAQVELAGMPTWTDTAAHGGPAHDHYLRFMKAECHWCELEDRARALLEIHDIEWAGEIAQFGWQANSTWVPCFEWEYRRGFVEVVSGTADDWFRHGRVIRAAAPIRRVELTTPLRVVRLGRKGAAWDRRPDRQERGKNQYPWGFAGERSWRQAIGLEVIWAHRDATVESVRRRLLETNWPGVEVVKRADADDGPSMADRLLAGP